MLHNDQVERPQKASKGDAVTTRKRAMSRPVDGLVGKFVWVVDDEKYGRNQCLNNYKNQGQLPPSNTKKGERK